MYRKIEKVFCKRIYLPNNSIPFNRSDSFGVLLRTKSRIRYSQFRRVVIKRFINYKVWERKDRGFIDWNNSIQCYLMRVEYLRTKKSNEKIGFYPLVNTTNVEPLDFFSDLYWACLTCWKLYYVILHYFFATWFIYDCSYRIPTFISFSRKYMFFFEDHRKYRSNLPIKVSINNIK